MSLKAVCAHEAGHTIAAVLLGWAVDSVKVMEDGEWKGLTSATSDGASLREKAGYFAAGRAAERTLTGDSSHTRWEQDTQEINALAQQEIGGDLGVPEMILPPDDKRRMAQFRKQAEDDAAELVNQYADAISAVAQALEKQHELTNEELKRIIAEVMKARTEKA